jgi:hypothetical protein
MLFLLTTFLLPSSITPLFGPLLLTTGDQQQKAMPKVGVEPTPLLSITFAPAGHGQ